MYILLNFFFIFFLSLERRVMIWSLVFRGWLLLILRGLKGWKKIKWRFVEVLEFYKFILM